jgi:hypothetical protein
MRFVPQTRVFYINKKYRSVFMVDVSSSVLTVDSGGTKIVMGQVMDTYVLCRLVGASVLIGHCLQRSVNLLILVRLYRLTKCLTGLSERFSCPGMKQDFVQVRTTYFTVVYYCHGKAVLPYLFENNYILS